MDIALTHGYFLRDDPTEQRIMKPYPPLGILYLSAYLKHEGFEVGVFDSTFESRPGFSRWMEEHRPPIVGVYVNLMTKLTALDLIRECKSNGSIVIVGGPEVPFYGEEFLRHGADIAVIGEGEHALKELILHLRTHGPRQLDEITGIIFIRDDGTVVRTPERAMIEDLDLMPDPDRESIDLRRYLDTWRKHHGMGSVSLICSRGCPFTCTWCSRSVFGETHRRRSPARVVDEIEYLIRTYQPDMLWFADDVFTINHRWFNAFYDEMIRRNIRIPFECISRADRLNPDILRKMAAIGARRIWYGSESGSQKILDAMQRRVTVEQIRTITHEARRHGIESGLFVMLGYPGERIADIDATIDHLVDANPDHFLTTVAYPIKGTPFYSEVADRLIVPGTWETITDRSLDFSGRHSKRFYWFATRHLINEVRYRKLKQAGQGGRSNVLASFLKSRIARLGMEMTEHEAS